MFLIFSTNVSQPLSERVFCSCRMTDSSFASFIGSLLSLTPHISSFPTSSAYRNRKHAYLSFRLVSLVIDNSTHYLSNSTIFYAIGKFLSQKFPYAMKNYSAIACSLFAPFSLSFSSFLQSTVLTVIVRVSAFPLVLPHWPLMVIVRAICLFISITIRSSVVGIFLVFIARLQRLYQLMWNALHW